MHQEEAGKTQPRRPSSIWRKVREEETGREALAAVWLWTLPDSTWGADTPQPPHGLGPSPHPQLSPPERLQPAAATALRQRPPRPSFPLWPRPRSSQRDRYRRLAVHREV